MCRNSCSLRWVYLERETSCLLLSYLGWYKKLGKIQFLFSVPHLECNVRLCHMLLRADQLWRLNTLYPSERDPLSHFKRLGGREQSLPGVRKKHFGVESAVGKPLCFTLVYSVYMVWPRKLSPVLYVLFKESCQMGCLHNPHKLKGLI